MSAEPILVGSTTVEFTQDQLAKIKRIVEANPTRPVLSALRVVQSVPHHYPTWTPEFTVEIAEAIHFRLQGRPSNQDDLLAHYGL